MALQDHIHLGLYTSWPAAHNDSRYYAAMPGYDDRQLVAVVAERGLTGRLLIHRTVDGSGNPLRFKDFGLLLTATAAEKTRLEALSGQTCYFIPNDHTVGTAHGMAGGWKVLMTIRSSQQITPDQSYWRIQIECKDDTL